MKRIFTILLSALVSIALLAQAPNMMDFQSLVRDASGNFVSNKTIGVQISILKTSATGTVVYRETHSVKTNANGLLTLTIGKGTVKAGTFASIDWSAGPYFLKTEMDVNGGTSYTLTQTTQMMSVPYALYANKAGNVPDVSALEARIAALETKTTNGSATYGSIVKTSDGAIPAAFSVSATKKVYFSQGCLLYHTGTKKLQFAADQLTGSTYVRGASSQWVSNFGWGTGNDPGKTSSTHTDYSTFTDWGVKPISNGGNVANRWFTLTDTEFNYLQNSRPNAAALKMVRSIEGGGTGLILLPDNFLKEAKGSYLMIWYNNTSVIPKDIWTLFESFGAVFLPYCAYCIYKVPSGLSSYYWSWEGSGLYYWWHTASRPSNAANGYRVRLVKNAQ